VLLFLARSVDIYEIRLALASHDVETAGRLAEDLLAGPGGAAMVRDLERLTLARVRLAQGWLDEALAGLAALAEEAEAGGHWGIWLECLALQGCVLEAQGNVAAALRVLTRALAWAEPEGFVRVFVDNGERMQRLLAALAHQLATRAQPETAPSAAYVARLLGAFDKSPAPDAVLQSEKASASMIEPLTARELEVLQLIAEGHSNRAIAEKLVITVSAVKKHTGNIFGKLNISSRTQAVARARQLGLLSGDG
jgi:LuxR family maltose regulon positive regulatory protein